MGVIPGLKGVQAATILSMARSAGIVFADAEGIDMKASGGSGAGPCGLDSAGGEG